MHKNKHKSHKDKHGGRGDHRRGADRGGRGHRGNDRRGGRNEPREETENERAKAQYAELDAEEVEHLKRLDEKYRDRARERREGLITEEDGEEEEPTFAKVIDAEGEETNVKKAGLDFDLFRKALEEEDKHKEESDSSDYSSSSEEEIKPVPKAKPKVVEEKPMEFRTKMGASIYKSLFAKAPVIQETRRNIFKGNCFYEYDVDIDFGSSLPKLIIKNREEDQNADPLVLPKINPNIFKKLETAMVYIKTGKRIEKEPVKVNHPRAPSTKPTAAADSDDDDDIFPDAKKKVKVDVDPSKSLFADLEEKKENSSAPASRGTFDKSALFKDTRIQDEADEYNASEITKKNQEMMTQLAAKRGEDKLNKLLNRDDSYFECFPEIAPELEDLKNQQAYVLKRNEQRREKQKSTKIGKDEVDKVNKMMQEKSSKKSSG